MNRLLAYLMTIVMVLVVLEIGLRILGFAPVDSINQPHPKIGWVKKPHATSRRATSEYDVTYTINSLGLRDKPGLTYEKPKGETRVLIVGDSFTLGYTVEPEDLFVNILEKRLRAGGLNGAVINGGTEGYSTDQELLWLREEGLKFNPDVVILAAYQNDVFWNSQDHYMQYPKPLFPPEGAAEAPENPDLPAPAERGWFAKNLAIGNCISRFSTPKIPTFEAKGGRSLPKEWGVLLEEEPDFIVDAWKRTAACLRGFKATCDKAGVKAIVALIPDKSQVHEEARAGMDKTLGLPPGAWSPDRPLEKLASLSKAAGLDVVNPLPLFAKSEAARTGREKTVDVDVASILEEGKNGEFYFQKDWHFTPSGNRLFALALYRHLAEGAFQGALSGKKIATLSPAKAGTSPGSGLPLWLIIAIAVWLFLGTLYILSFGRENKILSYLKVGVLVSIVAALIHGIQFLASALPPDIGRIFLILIVLAVIVAVLWKLGSRFGIIMELYFTFVNRGHWYMVPLLATMLTIGSLLVVAASSPLVAPFIYTLF